MDLNQLKKNNYFLLLVQSIGGFSILTSSHKMGFIPNFTLKMKKNSKYENIEIIIKNRAKFGINGNFWDTFLGKLIYIKLIY